MIDCDCIWLRIQDFEERAERLDAEKSSTAQRSTAKKPAGAPAPVAADSSKLLDCNIALLLKEFIGLPVSSAFGKAPVMQALSTSVTPKFSK
jgi:hypothetical protein